MNDDFFKMDKKGNDKPLSPDEILKPDGTIVTQQGSAPAKSTSPKKKMVGALTDKENFGKIIDIAGQIVEIQKIKANTQVQVTLLEQHRKNLQEETDGYVRRMREETNSTIAKARVIENMMKDFYKENNGSLTGQEFLSVILKVIDNLFPGEA